MDSASKARSVSIPRKYSRRSLLKAGVRVGIGSLTTGLGSLAWARKMEPGWLEVNRFNLKLPGLDPEFHGYRIAHVSDIHMDVWMTRQRLDHIVALTNQEKPDLVAITGDFVTYSPQRFAADLRESLAGLAPRDGTVAVLGNHDHWTNPELIRQVLQRAGIVELRNAVHTLRRGSGRLYLCGLDDAWMRQDRVDLVLEQLPPQGAAILLMHEPDVADRNARSGRFALQLSGHSHGGQICIPLFGPLVLPPYARKYPAGHYRVGTMRLYTSRGVGMVKPAVRFNCRPEIAVFTLQSQSATA